MSNTQDFLKNLEKVKDILEVSILVTLGIKSHTNIPNNKGIKAVKESMRNAKKSNWYLQKV